MRMTLSVCAAALLAATALAKDKKDAAPGPLHVTAKLVKIPGTFPPDDLYDYAYVMKYEVVGGQLDRRPLLVAHYKPRRARSEIKDKMRKHVAGTLRSFKEGEVHQMTLITPVKKVWKGALVDELFATDRTSTRYFCLRADPKK